MLLHAYASPKHKVPAGKAALRQTLRVTKSCLLGLGFPWVGGDTYPPEVPCLLSPSLKRSVRDQPRAGT